jgi:hypothetical protein
VAVALQGPNTANIRLTIGWGIAGRIFGERKKESMIEVNSLRLPWTHFCDAQPQS